MDHEKEMGSLYLFGCVGQSLCLDVVGLCKRSRELRGKSSRSESKWVSSFVEEKKNEIRVE